ncbi:MAG: glycosyltransferase [Proteobacteria bacterium]|nr:glycosyltransferase [Pseudomonadota bacterium]
MSNLPSVSVVIPQYLNYDFSVRAVEAVLRSTYEGPIEIVVFDDASPDGPGPLEDDSRVTLIVASRNAGFGPSVNAAAQAATGQLLLILNNDTVLATDCIERLVDTMETHLPRPGLVGPQYRTFDGEILEVGSYLDPDGSGWQGFRGETLPRSFRSGILHARYVSAAAILLDRATFVDAGGFDDVFAPAYYEDTDLAMRLHAEGRPVVVNPAAVAYHYEGGTSGTDTSVGIKQYQVKNKETFVSRWGEALADVPPVSHFDVHTQALALPGRILPILWAAPHLPRPDREAGHQRMVRMIEAIAGHGVPVAFWAEHGFDGERYGDALVERGVRWFGDPRSRSDLPQPHGPRLLQEVLDFADWSGVVVSFPELAERIIPIIREQRPALPIMVDVVDLHYLREERAVEVGASPHLSPGKAWELGIYASADGVIGSSSLETEILRKELPEIPSHTFAVAVEQPVEPEDASPGDDAVFLGNFDHHPNLDAVDWWVSNVYPEFEKKGAEPVMLTVVGSGSDRYADRWPPAAVAIGGWVPNLDDVFSTARVFVVPLRYGAGTKGKIMAAVRHGVPVVTTAIGAESMPVELAPALHVVDEPGAFADLVLRFMTDDAFAVEMRSQALGAVHEAWVQQQAVAAEFVSWVQRRVNQRARVQEASS